MFDKKTITILIAVLLGSGAFLIGKNIETSPAPAMIAVSGEGRALATPDIASLSFGIQTKRQPTAQAVMTSLTESMNEIIAAVKSLGIEDRDIQTEYLNLYPAYDWRDGERIDRGFEANQNLRVKVRDLEKIGAVLSAAAGAGANQVGGVSFTIDDPEELRMQARSEAIQKAQQKAQALAQELGVTLVKLRGFTDGNASPMPMYDRAVMMEGGMGGGGGGPLPVPSGEQEVLMNVTLTYEVR